MLQTSHSMGKKTSSSWLTAVKRAFRSPTKDSDSDKKSCRRKVDHPQQDDEAKSERRRWLFRKQSNSNATQAPVMPPEQRHAIAVAAATAAAAEAAVATAKAAVEMIRLTQPCPKAAALYKHETAAARVIQTAFRGYLARRALVALKGIVKLQALIRGQNVRKQANMTMKCMQSLLRVQARVRDQRARLSHDAGRRSMFAETTNLWESKYLRDIRDRNSRSREGSCVTDEWRAAPECPRTLEELEAILKARNEAALAHQKSSLAFAFAQQSNLVESDRSAYNGDESELDNRTNWLDKWMATKQWETSSRSSTDHRRDSIKTVEIDSLKTTNGRRSRCQSPINHRHSIASPHPRSIAPSTPSLASRTRSSPQVRPPSPRRVTEDRSYSTANTPSLRSAQRFSEGNAAAAQIPNYMAATESAKARIRSQSAPRQRAATPERERGGSAARKRLSYPIPEPYCVNVGFGCNNLGQNLRSPSFKSVQAGYVGMEEQSNYSWYTESIGGEISPCSTTDLRRWLR
ncbi:protein IQ-DOMAIN 17-like isoform X2 [Salvia splendens]|uniref:protein IQ-DOMAIN 17-like isoform X2 n=1 Tax=Salvia splendens TaxID=180675 RepID=UPI001C280555|nr:protein IQ-DOMAIN 17-like isoform X2 [Salvia splendens]